MSPSPKDCKKSVLGWLQPTGKIYLKEKKHMNSKDHHPFNPKNTHEDITSTTSLENFPSTHRFYVSFIFDSLNRDLYFFVDFLANPCTPTPLAGSGPVSPGHPERPKPSGFKK